MKVRVSLDIHMCEKPIYASVNLEYNSILYIIKK